MPARVKVGGTWRTLTPRVKVGGTWRSLAAGFVKVAGIWRPFEGGGRSFSFSPNAFIEMASAPTSSLPLTFAIWFKPNVLNDAQCVLSLSSAATARYVLENRSASGALMQAGTVNSSGTARGADAPAWTAGAWQHFAGTMTASATKSFRNGVAGSAGLSATALTGMTKTCIGFSYNANAKYNFADGLLAHAAIWSVVLSDAEIASLAAGALPSSVQSGSLIFYCPLTGGVAVDTITSTALTISGAVSSTDGPL